MKKFNKTTLALGTSIIAGLGASNVMAESSPFAMQELSAGYMNLAEADGMGQKSKDGSCGEGKCGGKKSDAKSEEGKCGEGKCGDSKPAEKSEEGKCGEGKCGDSKPAEKSEEGKCGEGKCGGKSEAKDSEGM